MKLSHLILLTACTSASTAYAATDNTSLPPVLDSSIAYRTAMLQPINLLTTRLDQVQASISAIQAKVNQHSVALESLKQAQNVVNSNVATVDAKVTNLAVKNIAIAKPIVALKPVTTKAPTLSGSEKQRYQSAYNTFRSGNVDSAMVFFQQIIKDFPKSSLADNAQYWLGEAYLLKGKKTEAMQAFDKVVLEYPKSNKVPDALLKLGFVQLELNNKAKAKEYLDYVILNYPKTNAAKLAILKATKAAL